MTHVTAAVAAHYSVYVLITETYYAVFTDVCCFLSGTERGAEIIQKEMRQYAYLLARQLKRVEGSRPLSAAWAIDNLYEARVD
mgnify:CR=1 FL=1